MMPFGILVDGKVVPETDPDKWSDWMSDFEARKIRKDIVPRFDVEVSTVFLGIGHRFETIVLTRWGGCPRHVQHVDGTVEDAIRMHEEVLALFEDWA